MQFKCNSSSAIVPSRPSSPSPHADDKQRILSPTHSPFWSLKLQVSLCHRSSHKDLNSNFLPPPANILRRCQIIFTAIAQQHVICFSPLRKVNASLIKEKQWTSVTLKSLCCRAARSRPRAVVSVWPLARCGVNAVRIKIQL